METRPKGNCAPQTFQKSLEENFYAWMKELKQAPEEIVQEVEPPPDLYSFFAELSALRSEIHRSAKRDHEAFTGFKEILGQFENTLRTLTREQLKQVRSSQSQKQDEVRQHAFRLAVVNIFERFQRIRTKLDKPPSKRLFFSDAKWRSGWDTLKEGFRILEEHFQNLLGHEGIYRMTCKGRTFDPNCMKAVDFELIDSVPANTVIDELSGGYFYRKQVLKYAEVKVAVAKGDL